jgi:hypothetical protein
VPAVCRQNPGRIVLELDVGGVGERSCASRRKSVPVAVDPHLGEDGHGPPQHWLVSGYGAEGTEEASMETLWAQELG